MKNTSLLHLREEVEKSWEEGRGGDVPTSGAYGDSGCRPLWIRRWPVLLAPGKPAECAPSGRRPAFPTPPALPPLPCLKPPKSRRFVTTPGSPSPAGPGTLGGSGSRLLPPAAAGVARPGVSPCPPIPTPSPRLGQGDTSATQLRATPSRQRDPPGGGGTSSGWLRPLAPAPLPAVPRLPARRSPCLATGSQQDEGERGRLGRPGAQGPGHGPPRTPERSGGRKREGGERKSLFSPFLSRLSRSDPQYLEKVFEDV